jgi:hypothetical protein
VKSLPNIVLTYVIVVALLCMVWFLLKGTTGGQKTWLYRWARPRVAAVRTWVGTAPATFTYVAIWTATSILLQGQPVALSELVSRFASTNLVNFHSQPVRSMVASGLLVAGDGLFFLGYLLTFVVVVARLEHRIGSARFIVLVVATHVGGSLLILAIERWGIIEKALARSVAATTDVGVSYVMVGALGGYVWLVGRTWRWPYYAGLFVAIVLPAVLIADLGSLGHLLACLLGVGMGRLMLVWQVRPALRWRDLVARETAVRPERRSPASPAS